jgi:hypothetical protein
MLRYKVVAGLYGGYDITDTSLGASYRICTCFKSEDAQRICDAMNEQNARDVKESHESI